MFLATEVPDGLLVAAVISFLGLFSWSLATLFLTTKTLRGMQVTQEEHERRLTELERGESDVEKRLTVVETILAHEALAARRSIEKLMNEQERKG